MEKYGFHYLTDEPKKIIDFYKRREKRTVADLKFAEEMWAKMVDTDWDNRRIAVPPNTISLSNMEDIVIHQNGRVFSVYTSPTQIAHKELWSNFDTRTKSVAQKLGSLLIMQNDAEIGMELWHKGDMLAESYGENPNQFYSLLGIYFPQTRGKLHSTQLEKASKALGFPLLLPDDWEERWNISKISEHIIMALE